MNRDDWALLAECIGAGLFTFVGSIVFFWILMEVVQ